MLLVYKFFNLIYKLKFYTLYIFVYDVFKLIKEHDDIIKYKSLISNGNIVVDGGANVGFYTILFSKLVGDNGKVIAFEPDINNYEVLKKRTAHLKNVQIIDAALSDHTGNLDLFLSDELNVDHKAYDSGEGRSSVKVKSYTLDDFLESIGIEAINFIKTDLQGYDPIALRGMKKTIQNSANLKLSCEFWPYGMKKAGIDPLNWLFNLKELKLQTDFVCNQSQINDKNYYQSIWLTKSND
jgi:FkbM family methyltransferase